MNNSRGKDNENKHIPKYIKAKPWYYESAESEDYLVHHRQSQNKKNALNIDQNDQPQLGQGIRDSFIHNDLNQSHHHNKNLICTNCGAFDHVKKDCIERPRKIRQQLSTGNNQNNNVINEKELDWDARKDRWFGYTGKEYDETLRKWEHDKNEKSSDSTKNNEDKEYDTDEEIELRKLNLFKYQGATSKQNSVNDTSVVTTAVRLREDRAAYLNDINSDKINYDPKSRLYKSEDLGSVDEKSNMFRRHLTGEGLELSKLNQIARGEAKKAGIRDEISDQKKIDHILIANPTKYDLLMKKQMRGEQRTTGEGKDKIDLTKAEANKINGTKQDKKSREQLKDMYQ